MSIAVICGGVGAARLLRGLLRVVDPTTVTAIVNVADDMTMHGLSISPDLDTITYTLAEAVSNERGWGLEGETWQAMNMLGRLGGDDWFSLGDRDLGTHLYRTQRLASGDQLHEITASIAQAWGLSLAIVPATNDPIRTRLTTSDGADISFQEYFVKFQHDVAISSVYFDQASAAQPAPGVIEALATSDRIIVAPSNPIVSIDPVLAVAGIREHLTQRRNDVVAVSPLVGGKAIKGPADRLMVELGYESSALGVARYYREIVGTMVIDSCDAEQHSAIEGLGMRCIVGDTIMSDLERSAALATLCCQ